MLIFFIVVLANLATAGTNKGNNGQANNRPTNEEAPIWTLNANLSTRPEYESAPYTSKVVYGADGSVGIWDGKKYIAALDHSYTHLDEMECTEEFEDWDRKMFDRSWFCGDEHYELRKHANLLHAFGNKAADESDIVAGNMQDVAIVLMDGCVECDFDWLMKKELEESKKNLTKPASPRVAAKVLPTVTGQIWTSYSLKAGSRFTSCKAETVESDKFSMLFKTNASALKYDEQWTGRKKAFIREGSLFLVSTLYQRSCMGLFWADPVPEYYEGMKLHIKHNCNLENKEETMEVPLPDVWPKKHRQHVAEMIGLKFVLHEKKLIKYRFRPDGTLFNKKKDVYIWQEDEKEKVPYSAGLFWDSLVNMKT